MAVELGKRLRYASGAATWSTDDTACTIPGGAASFSAAMASTSQINLAWTAAAPVGDHARWQVNFATGATPPATPTSGTVINSFDPATLSYAHTGCAAGTQYSYSIWAFTREGTYGPAKTTTATTQQDVPDAPGIYWNNMGATYNNLTAQWPAAARAVSYNVYLAWPGQPKYLYHNSSALTFGWTFGAMDTKHEMWVESVSSTGAVSSQSYLSGCSGHPQASKSGSFAYEANTAATGTWRNDGNNWGYNGTDVLQGWYTNSAYNAYGTAAHDGPAFQNWVGANYGWDVVGNLNWTRTALYVIRQQGTGTGNAVSQTYYVSSAWPGQGGQPAIAGGQAIGSHPPNGIGTWDDGLAAWWGGHVLLNQDVAPAGVCRSFVMMRNNSADYSRYRGTATAADGFRIHVECNWNFVTQNQQNTYQC